MKKKLYCTEGGEIAYGIDWWRDEAFDRQDPIIIELEKSDLHSGNMWCGVESEFVERGCNEGCDSYNPCNGVSGRCRHMKNSLIGTGIFYTVYPSGKVAKR